MAHQKRAHTAPIGERGQVVIAKPIRDALGIRPKQLLLQRIEGRRVVLEPVPDPRELRGRFPQMMKGARSVADAKRRMEGGWEPAAAGPTGGAAPRSPPRARSRRGHVDAP